MKKSKLLLVLILLLIVSYNISNLNVNEDAKKVIEVEEHNISEIEEYELNLAMVGDALIHDGVYKDAYNSNTGYDFKKHLELLKPIIQEYDLAFYNQETILGGTELGLSTYPRFNSPYEVGDAFVDAGFNLVSLANNHTLDRGEPAILNSIQYWNDKDVYYSGSYDSNETRDEIRILEKNGITYALLAYTTMTNGLSIPEEKEYLLNVYSDDMVKKDIEKIKDNVDVIIVSMHWGDEYQLTPNDEQIRIANYLALLEVDIVIGTHPHVVQPIEYIGKTLVLYSLGNVISAQNSSGDYQKRIGLLSSVNIKKTIEEEKVLIEINNTDNELLYTYYENYRNFKIVPFRFMNNDYHKDYLRLYEKYSAVVKSKNKSIPVREVVLQ